MGRLLGFLFFIVLFVVFLILKAVLQGGKAAYDAVFEEERNATNRRPNQAILNECYDYIENFVQNNPVDFASFKRKQEMADGILRIFNDHKFYPTRLEALEFVDAGLRELNSGSK